MATIANLEAILRLDDQMTGQLNKSAGALSKLGTVAATAGGFLLAQGIGKIVSGIGGMVSAGMDFETQMANVNSIAQLSAPELQSLSDQVLNLTNNPGITQGPANLAEGLYNIQSSGFEGAAAMQVLEQSALAATAGMTTTETAARAIAGTMNAYGQETYTAQQIADIFFKTVDSGVITFEELANNLGDTTALASNLGVGIEQLGAAYATLTLNNVNASAAETQIASLMRAAINPTTALTEAVQAQGYASAEALINAEGLPGFLRVLTEASGGSAESLGEMLGSAEAANAALILGGKGADQYADSLAEMTEQLENGGAMNKALQKQMQSSSFAIAKMKQQLQVLATIGFGMLAPVITRAAQGLTRFISGGLIPFGRVLGSALRGGNDFRKLLGDLPQPLRRTAGALGSVFESLGDVARAFGDRGLTGAIQTLTRGGELRQIGTALSAIADEAWNALVIGFNAINWGAVWDIAVSGITAAAGVAVDLADWTINVAAPAVITWLGEGVGNLWGWLKGQLGIGSGTTGDGTGGPETDRNVTISDWLLDVAAPNVTGWIADAAGDAWPYIKQAAGWAATQAYNFGVWELTVALPKIVGWLKAASGDPWTSLKQAVGGWASDQAYRFGNWSLDVAAPEIMGWLSTHKGDIWNGLKTLAGIPGKIQGAVTDWVLTVAAPSLGGWLADIGGNFWGWLKGQMGLGGGGGNDAMGGYGARSGIINDGGGGDALGLSDWISGMIAAGLQAANNAVVGLLNDFATDVEGWKTDITDAIKGIVPDNLPDLNVPDISIDTSGILGAVDDFIKFIDEQIKRIKDAWARLAFWQNDESRGTPRQTNGQDFGGTNNQPSSQPGTLASGEVVTSLPRVGSGPSMAPIVIPAPDTSAFDAVMDAITSATYTAKLDLDIGQAAIAYTNASTFAEAWDAATFIGTFDADNGPAAIKYTDASTWGAAWDAATFTATFAGDNGPAAVAYTDAYGWGDTFAGTTFTATFSVDLSPLENALVRTRQIVAEISALLPHSPAKKGPLARPISFGYIADNLLTTMDRMQRTAESGMDRVSAAMRRADGISAGMAAEGAGYGANGGGFKNYGNYYEADRYWAPEQTLMSRGIQRGRR